MTESASEGLLRKLRITAACRYGAARRLTYHNRLSRWSSALASVALMVLAVPFPENLGQSLEEPVVRILQFFLALFLLIYSLLVSGEDYSLEADRMHRCGVELTALALRLKRMLEKEAVPSLGDIENEYHRILSTTRNHNVADYYTASLQRQWKNGEETPSLQQIRWWLGSFFRNALGYLHYLIVLAIFAYLGTAILRII